MAGSYIMIPQESRIEVFWNDDMTGKVVRFVGYFTNGVEHREMVTQVDMNSTAVITEELVQGVWDDQADNVG